MIQTETNQRPNMVESWVAFGRIMGRTGKILCRTGSNHGPNGSNHGSNGETHESNGVKSYYGRSMSRIGSSHEWKKV